MLRYTADLFPARPTSMRWFTDIPINNKINIHRIAPTSAITLQPSYEIDAEKTDSRNITDSDRIK